MNYVDIILIVIFVLYVLEDFRRGFLRLTAELIGLALAFVLALKYFTPLGLFIEKSFGAQENISKIIAFVFIWIVVQTIVYIISKIISSHTPNYIRKSRLNLVFGLIPAFLKAGLFVAVLLMLGVVAPLSTNFKDAVRNSFFGRTIMQYTWGFELQMQSTLAPQETQVANHSGETILEEQDKLGFTTTNMTIDTVSEDQMLDRINQERYNNNLKPLVSDPLLKNVARAYSRNMLVKGFFSHVTPEGITLFDRLLAAKVNYNEAGENLAFAPTIQLAHIGLMNSPKHRKNILDPEFTKVGIGIIDAGSYGKMFTQEFAN